jgi:hypothetical protein
MSQSTVRDTAWHMEPLWGTRAELVTVQCERMKKILDFMVQSAWAPYTVSLSPLGHEYLVLKIPVALGLTFGENIKTCRYLQSANRFQLQT